MPAVTPAQCAEKIRRAGKIAVLTGAGMSTAAGIPDFRGPKGLYVTRAYDPETVFEISCFDRDPKPFYKFSRDFLGLLSRIEPTSTHRFLARLEAEGRDIGIVTQNIDGLHQKAGSHRVYPIHGDYQTSGCRRCGAIVGLPDLLELMEEAEVPVCRGCGGVIKPDIVFFGENVRHLEESSRLAASSDLMLVLGSSLAVYPAAGLPDLAGGEVVIVNRGSPAVEARQGWHLADADLDGFFHQVEKKMLNF
ncbi:MAG: Sir2 family NAD-dependent protein deacetylase [Planctomycetes bacterium]|nr:Sir2 family NAD-dependent protein deacetylase [Planctomycetota bacterium]